jgi:hypothetical protein
MGWVWPRVPRPRRWSDVGDEEGYVALRSRVRCLRQSASSTQGETDRAFLPLNGGASMPHDMMRRG